MAYGVTASGFNRKTLEDCRSELESALKEAFGNEIDVSAASVFGQIIGIFAEREADNWDAMEDVYLSAFPDSATGTALVDVCSITGTIPNEATKSTVTATIAGTNGTSVTTGRIFQVASSGARFVTTETVTITTLTSWVNTTGYAVGDRRKNGGNAYECITAGTSAGSGGPTTTAADITDGTVHWKFLIAGTAIADVDCEGEETGPSVANAGTLTAIVTAVAGLASVTNMLDADLGEDLETDDELRIRRENELRLAGKGTVEAIREDLLATDDVEAAIVYENTTDATVDSLPPHSIECVILGDALTTDLAATIWASKPAGIATYGTETETITDSQGITHDINFSYADEKLLWMVVDVTKNTSVSMSNAEIQAAVKAALVAWADENYGLGDDVVTSRLDQPIWDDEDLTANLYDVSSITTVLKATTPGGGEYNVSNKAITEREIAIADTSRITVNVS